MDLKKIIKLSFFHARLISHYKLLFFLRFVQNGFQSKTILFYPQKPEHRNVIYKILCNLGYKITSNPEKKYDLVFNWEDSTFREYDEKLRILSEGHKVLNIGCKDISKKNVENIFSKVFGYSLSVDPLKYSGKCIVKSNFNAYSKNKKQVLMCPLKKAEENLSYEKMINTKNKSGFLVDFRVPVFKNKIPLVYVRVKEGTEIFSDGIKPKLFAEKPEKIFSKKELKNILEFAKKIHLDVGEMDILRDNKDKKIYIVDVNTTPFGLHNVPNDFRQKALRILSESFKQEFFKN